MPPRTAHPAGRAAPPHHTAATDIAPQANPGRRRYQPARPPRRRERPSKSTGALTICGRPRACHGPGCAVTPGARRSTAKSPRFASSTKAVTSAWRQHRCASEHHALVPSRRPGRRRRALRAASSPEPRPHRRPTTMIVVAPTAPMPHGSRSCARSVPACSRIASASRCGSRIRAAATSIAAVPASSSHSCVVLPEPGRGAVARPRTHQSSVRAMSTPNPGICSRSGQRAVDALAHRVRRAGRCRRAERDTLPERTVDAVSTDAASPASTDALTPRGTRGPGSDRSVMMATAASHVHRNRAPLGLPGA